MDKLYVVRDLLISKINRPNNDRIVKLNSSRSDLLIFDQEVIKETSSYFVFLFIANIYNIIP